MNILEEPREESIVYQPNGLNSLRTLCDEVALLLEPKVGPLRQANACIKSMGPLLGNATSRYEDIKSVFQDIQEENNILRSKVPELKERGVQIKNTFDQIDAIASVVSKIDAAVSATEKRFDEVMDVYDKSTLKSLSKLFGRGKRAKGRQERMVWTPLPIPEMDEIFGKTRQSIDSDMDSNRRSLHEEEDGDDISIEPQLQSPERPSGVQQPPSPEVEESVVSRTLVSEGSVQLP